MLFRIRRLMVRCMSETTFSSAGSTDRPERSTAT